MGILEVTGDEGPKTFLACRIPQLEAISLIIVDNIAHEEVNADGGLRGWRGTL